MSTVENQFSIPGRHYRDCHHIADRYSSPRLYVFIYEQEEFPLPGNQESFKRNLIEDCQHAMAFAAALKRDRGNSPGCRWIKGNLHGIFLMARLQFGFESFLLHLSNARWVG